MRPPPFSSSRRAQDASKPQGPLTTNLPTNLPTYNQPTRKVSTYNQPHINRHNMLPEQGACRGEEVLGWRHMWHITNNINIRTCTEENGKPEDHQRPGMVGNTNRKAAAQKSGRLSAGCSKIHTIKFQTHGPWGTQKEERAAGIHACRQEIAGDAGKGRQSRRGGHGKAKRKS